MFYFPSSVFHILPTSNFLEEPPPPPPETFYLENVVFLSRVYTNAQRIINFQENLSARSKSLKSFPPSLKHTLSVSAASEKTPSALPPPKKGQNLFCHLVSGQKPRGRWLPMIAPQRPSGMGRYRDGSYMYNSILYSRQYHYAI